ncbi:class I SAM-dependent methyltransferase [uncultured Brevundimonas sp.]|uniref:class I SAM-dependent methyltransferase n=1 Tax=uncultured Brevundimonas sp. TaxID=213418 RepID=UPI0025F6D756|nr:class I SAM-dependent methyltransferase [uncultured Brevundimonas sp.]
MKSLDEIGLEHRTDKASNHHDFLRFYDRRLSALRNHSFTLLEIGVYRGGSVRTWSEYFPNATIVGLDITEECVKYAGGNIHVRIGDATHTDFLFDVIQEFGVPTVIVDDGSHRWDHQITTLQVLFPILRKGGVYIVEDLDTSFNGHLKSAPFDGLSPISAFDYLVKLSRCVTGDNALDDERPHDLFIADNAPWVGSVEFGRRTAVLSKKTDRQAGSF